MRFWHITWPLLRPSAAFVATTSLIISFQAFDVVRIMTQGGPVHATELFVYAIYEQIFMNLRVGRASALVVVFSVLILALTGLQLRAWRGQEGSVKTGLTTLVRSRRRGGGAGLGRAVRSGWSSRRSRRLPELLHDPLALCPKTLTSRPIARCGRSVPSAVTSSTPPLMALLIALLQIALALPAGYALAKLRFVGEAPRSGSCWRVFWCRRR